MLREAREESGQRMKIVKVGPLIEYLDRYGRAVAVPFILKPEGTAVLPTEHSESRWVRLSDLGDYEIVPDLERALSLFRLVKARGPNPRS